MIIKSIELKNIRSHKSTVLNFSKGITVLSGRTGCGKSTFFMSLEYALFGADVNLNNNSLLRRGVKNGFVHLIFNTYGKDYEVMRGMKKSGDRIIADPDNLWIKEAGSTLNMIARSNEVNEKILEILHYASDVKPKDLFEIMSYAKQDEIRKLIELTSSEREKFIDRVLQLSKYELTYENMKFVINKLSNELALLKGRIEGLIIIEKTINTKENELKELNNELQKIDDALTLSTKMLNLLKEDYEVIKNKREELETVKGSYDNKKGLLDGMITELKKLEEEIKKYNNLPKESIIESLIQEQASLSQERRHALLKITEFKEELKNFSTVGATCPLCKQNVTKDYQEHVRTELLKKISEAELAEKIIINKLDELSKKIVLERKNKEVIESLKHKSERISELNEKITWLEKTLNELLPKVTDYETIKKDYIKANEKYSDASSKNNVLIEKKNNTLINIKKIVLELNKSKEDLLNLEKSKNDALIITKKLALLERLREDIRSIRTIVRTKFLEDFRHEFQRKYEEIRQEDNYTVDINNDYEPIAYSEGEETSINALSGGERTSVALAYRLALSEIASEVSSLEHSDLLMLDEPTTGFDRRDINVLPEALKAIKRIPQIIIVTHEDELKDAADVKYELVKKNGITEIL